MGLEAKQFQFTDFVEMRLEEEKPHYIGQDALNMHRNEEFTIRRPMRYGNLNVTPTYSMKCCLDDLSDIVHGAIEKELKLPKENGGHSLCLQGISSGYYIQQ